MGFYLNKGDDCIIESKTGKIVYMSTHENVNRVVNLKEDDVKSIDETFDEICLTKEQRKFANTTRIAYENAIFNVSFAEHNNVKETSTENNKPSAEKANSNGRLLLDE